MKHGQHDATVFKDPPMRAFVRAGPDIGELITQGLQFGEGGQRPHRVGFAQREAFNADKVKARVLRRGLHKQIPQRQEIQAGAKP